MKSIDDLTLQAYVDGELSARQCARIEALLRTDARAAALVAELRMTRQVLAANEPEIRLPESVDFHWSKIARQIDRSGATPQFRWGWVLSLRWLRYAAPAAVAAALAMLVMLQPGNHLAGHEVYTESAPEISPLVFQSHEEGMTVIWLQGDENSEFANPEGSF